MIDERSMTLAVDWRGQSSLVNWFDDGHLEFVAFDFPELAATWDKRIIEAAKALKKSACARAIEFERIGDPQHLVRFMLRIRAAGGEGDCFRNPDCDRYETGRTENLLRWKFDNQN